MNGDVGTVNFFFNDTATTEIYTLSLHDALPIFRVAATTYRAGKVGELELVDLSGGAVGAEALRERLLAALRTIERQDRKSTRLNSSHANISYAVFCLKKKQHT